MTGAIFCERRPATIIRSAWRGEGRKTSAPKRATSKRAAAMDIISIAQQARPKPRGQMELFRAQFTALSSVVKMMPSSSSSLPKSSGLVSVTCLPRDTLICSSSKSFSHSETWETNRGLKQVACSERFASSRRSGKASDAKHNFAKLRAGFEISVSGSGFRQREDAVDNGFEAAGRDEFHYRVQLGLGAHVRAEERKLAAEQEAEIKLGIVAGRCAARDQTASWSETGEALFPSSRADMLEDDVDAALASDAANFLADLLRFVVNPVIGAKLLGFLELFVGAGRGDDASPEGFGDLYRGAAYAAARSEDEDVFAGLQLGAGHQYVPGGLEDQRNRSSLFERQIFRVRQAIHFRGADIFGAAAVNHVAKIGGLPAVVVQTSYASRAFAAANQRREHDLLADASRGYILADLSDLARNVASGNVRQRNRHVRQTAADPEVKVIQRAGLDAHENLIWLDLWLGVVLVLENFRPAVLMKNDCFHGTSGARLRARKVASMEKSVQNAACIDTDQAAP